jgi:hypothetical protein
MVILGRFCGGALPPPIRTGTQGSGFHSQSFIAGAHPATVTDVVTRKLVAAGAAEPIH